MFDLKSLQQNIFRRQKTVRRKRKTIVISANRDWRVLVVLFAVINIALIGYGIYMAVNFNKETYVFEIKEEGNGVPTINRSMLEDTLFLYDQKKEQFDILLSGDIDSKDPSR